MRCVIATLMLLVSAYGLASASESGFGGIQLLEGYHAKRVPGLDTVGWTIQGKNDFVIHFESGPSEGRIVDLKDKEKYAWYREQTINGHAVLVALVKPGLKTDPGLDAERNLPPGNILLVTFALSSHRDHAANFVGKIANQVEMIDMLLMVLTFDPSKGNF
jgi:hypothetical protein